MLGRSGRRSASPPDACPTTMRDEFLVFGKPAIGEAEIAEVVDSLRAGWVGTGPKVQRFERALEAYLHVPHVRSVSSCTAALMLAIRVLGIGRGDEVIVPAMTFVASANAVEHAGATVVLVDSEPVTGLVDLERLNAIRDRHGLLVIEDAAHAIGAEWKGVRIGGHGNLTAYSFYATK